MRVLIITNLFPNAKQPHAASFNRQQFAALGKTCDVKVLATLPWYPGQRLLGRFATRKVAQGLPTEEYIDGLKVFHPKTLHLPKVGTSISAPLFAASLLPLMYQYRSKVDVVLGSWAHPDGCAAVALARFLGVPSVVKLHGSDINVLATMPGPRRVMKKMLPKADAIISVSSALSEKVAALGVARERIHLVMNGVDSSLFHPRSRAIAREALGLPKDGSIALYVGNLIQAKGVEDLGKAFTQIADKAPGLHLYFVGEGSSRAVLSQEMHQRITLVGSQPLERVAQWMAACDLLVLPSWNEGTPNVVLEALACGRRVLATDVGGIPDLLAEGSLGTMVSPGDVQALGDALLRECSVSYDPQAIATQGAHGDWDTSAARLRTVLASVIA